MKITYKQKAIRNLLLGKKLDRRYYLLRGAMWRSKHYWLYKQLIK